MDFSLLSVGFVLAAALFLFLGTKILFRSGWLAGFIIGVLGVGCFALAVFSVLLGVNISAYQTVEKNQPYLYISFKETGEQQYQVNILNAVNGEVKDVDIQGDTWQLTVKSMRLIPASKIYYQLDHIRSRYYALEQEQQALTSQSMVDLRSKIMAMDIANWLKSYGNGAWTSVYLKNAYFPAADGARYSVTATAEGLSIKAENRAAIVAVEEWL